VVLQQELVELQQELVVVLQQELVELQQELVVGYLVDNFELKFVDCLL